MDDLPTRQKNEATIKGENIYVRYVNIAEIISYLMMYIFDTKYDTDQSWNLDQTS